MNDTVGIVSKLVKLVKDVRDALEGVADASSLSELITPGQLRNIADIGKAVQIGKDLPSF